MVYGEQWEYRRIGNPTENNLNILGLQGWELVAVTSDRAYVGDAFLKRKKG